MVFTTWPKSVRVRRLERPGIEETQRPRASRRHGPTWHARRAFVLTLVVLFAALLFGVAGLSSAGASPSMSVKPASSTAAASVHEAHVRPRTLRTLADVVSGTITTDGTPTSVSITNAGDTAALTFTETAGHYIYLEFSGSFYYYSNVVVSNPDGTQLESGAFGSEYLGRTLVSQTGTYTITLSPNSSTPTGDATFTLFDVPVDSYGGTITTDGTPSSITISTPGQRGYLTFSGTAGESIFVAIGNGFYFWSNVVLVNPDGTTLATTSFGSGSGYIDKTTLPQTGTYQLWLYPDECPCAGDLTGQAAFQIYQVPADDSGTVAIGGAATMTITTPGQRMYRTFDGTAGQVVTLTWTGAFYYYSSVNVNNPDGSTLTSSNWGPFNTGSLTTTLPTTGTYKVSVNPYMGFTDDRTGTATIQLDLGASLPDVAEADDTGTVYTLDSDGAYHALPDSDTTLAESIYWCQSSLDWCGATHYSSASSFPAPTGSPITSCACEFWVELPDSSLYQYEQTDGEYHQIPDSDTALALGLSSCGSDWCLVHHDATLPGSLGDAMPSVDDNRDDAFTESNSTDKGVRVDQVRGFAAPTNGARATWVVGQESAPEWFDSDHVNHTIWVGANGQNPDVTWVEVGNLAGSQEDDQTNHWTYYSARGINCSADCLSGSYSAVNFSLMDAPSGTHVFAAFYSGTSFQIDIDGAAHYYWPSVTGPTIEYDVGLEATCATSCYGGTADTSARTFVSNLDSHRSKDAAWVPATSGTLRLNGNGSGSGIQWCYQPESFRDWLNYSGDIYSCG